MIAKFAAELNLITRPTDIKVQKIDDFVLKTYDIVIVEFLISDKLHKIRFFEKTFLLFEISIKIVLRMFFLTLSNVDI